MVDQRPSHVRHLNERMVMSRFESKADWEKWAEWLREHILVSCGLMPLPEKTPLKPQVFDKIERDGYSIEKAYFESRPGFYTCGNLYRPLGKKGPFPGVACPHGHWGEGRFGNEGEPSGSVPARCITLARLGCVVFAYDMVGYNDSGKQISHRWSSPRDELWGISVMGLQSWNTLRAIDFLQGLPDVDPERIAVTGASGGGTQTFMVMGIEPRVKVAAPVNMISCTMQGGCVCENAPLLRIETNNMEIGALMAPRPLLMVSASGDWTKETPKVEFPAVRSVYELYGAADKVENAPFQAPHNYNKASREAMYNFFLKHLLGTPPEKPYVEPPFTVEKKEDLLVWQGRKLPDDARNQKTLEDYMIGEARRQRDELLPAKADGWDGFLPLAKAYSHAVLATLPGARDLEVQTVEADAKTEPLATRLLLGRKGCGDRVPAVLYRPKKAAAKAPACLVVHPEGKAKLVDPELGAPGSLVGALLEAGHVVLAIDPYLAGESAPLQEVLKKNQNGKNFFSAYNRTAVVERVQDILTALAYLKSRRSVGVLSLVGVGQAGAWCLLAAPFTPEGTRVVADLAQLSGDEDSRWLHDLFTPCILKAGGLSTAAALAVPRPLFVHNVADGFDTKPFRAVYRAADAAGALRIEQRECGEKAIASWLAGG